MRLGRGRVGRRRRPPPTRAAHHGGDASGRQRPGRRAASGAAAHRGRAPVFDLRRHLRGVVQTRRAAHRLRARTTRVINRRLRRALEHRDPTCAVPGCGATRGLHAHHIRHWEDGGPTELDNLVLVCPYHHRLHHRGVITITGPAAPPDRHRQRGRHLEPRLTRPSTDETPAVRAAIPGSYRRTRRLVVVRTLPTTTATEQQLSQSHTGAPLRGVNHYRAVRHISELTGTPRLVVMAISL